MDLSQWFLGIFTSLSISIIEPKNEYDTRINRGVKIFLRLTGKVEKTVQFNFKKEILQLFFWIIFFFQFIILLLSWYSLFSWQTLIISILLIPIAKIIIYLLSFLKIKNRDILFDILDFVFILFIVYFIKVLFF